MDDIPGNDDSPDDDLVIDDSQQSELEPELPGSTNETAKGPPGERPAGDQSTGERATGSSCSFWCSWRSWRWMAFREARSPR